MTVNRFRYLEIKIEEARSGIEVALEKRYQLLTRLLESVKAFMKHETEIFQTTIRLRKGMSVNELHSASDQMDEWAHRIQATAEAYPELRSAELFQQLQQGVFEAEEHLQAARRLYNSNVSLYNTAITLFPARLLAGKRLPETFFETDESKKADVPLRFE